MRSIAAAATNLSINTALAFIALLSPSRLDSDLLLIKKNANAKRCNIEEITRRRRAKSRIGALNERKSMPIHK